MKNYSTTKKITMTKKAVSGSKNKKVAKTSTHNKKTSKKMGY